MEALSIARADDKLNAFANADPKALANLGVKTLKNVPVLKLEY